jgi:aminoglycoside 3-N-acetyltransferase
MFLLSRLPPGIKSRLRVIHSAARRTFVRAFRSYGPTELAACLALLGVRQGDCVLLHSAFAPHYGFVGSIDDLTDVFLRAVGPQGHLLMVSLPYRSSSLGYLEGLRQFDVRKAPSMMGLVSEFFRRRPDVIRSLHPTHPVLVHGRDAEYFVDEHPRCAYPCGPGTPFEKLLERDGMVVFFNVPFAVFTFFHYLEHLVSGDLPFPLYTAFPFVVPVIDRNGDRKSVSTYVFSKEAIGRRRFEVLEHELRHRRLIESVRIGNGEVLAIRVRSAVECVEDMRRQGRYFYDLSGLPDVAKIVPSRERAT